MSEASLGGGLNQEHDEMRLIESCFVILVSVALAAAVVADDIVYFDEDGGAAGPRGLYTLDTVTGVATLRATVGGTERFFSMAVQPNTGTVFAMQIPGGSTLWTIDLNTGATTMIVNTNLDTVTDITFDPLTGDLYGQERNGTFRVFRIDPVTGASTVVGPTRSEARVGLIFSPEGELFAFSRFGKLFSLNRSNGEATLIGGGGLSSLVEDSVFTPNGELFVVTWDGKVHEIDPKTGASTLVHTTGLGDGLLSVVNIPASSCYADCDPSTGAGVLDLFDFLCFQGSFVAGETYACDCDTSTGPLVCDLFDFLCFQGAFVGGCP